MSDKLGGIFHFGLLFDNPTFSMKRNGIEVCPKGQRRYLFVDHNYGDKGVILRLMDEAGKDARESGEKGSKGKYLGLGKLETKTEYFTYTANFK